MKHKLYLFICFSLFLPNIAAQEKATTVMPVELKWKGAERWSISDSIYTDVITFERAMYLGEKNLPHYYYEMPADAAYSYQAEVRNAVYTPVGEEELKILSEISFSEAPLVKSGISTSRGNKSFGVSVFPFVIREGQPLKLNSFDLVLTKTKQSQADGTESSIHSFADASVLSKGRFVKVRITESGLYKLTYSELRNKGIEPSNVRLFGYGGAVQEEDFSKPKHDDLPEVAVYDTGSAILFYAQGVNKWTYDSNKKKFTHLINPYSTYGYYFVTSDNAGEKKRIKPKAETVAQAPKDVTVFTDYAVHEKELASIINSGRKLYGESLTSGAAAVSASFNFPNIVKSANLDVRASAAKSGSFFLRLNGGSSKNISPSSYTDHTFTTTSDNLSFSLSFSGDGIGYLDYIEVNAVRNLKMTGSYMTFHNRENIADSSYNRYVLETGNSSIKIWDINNLVDVREIPAAKSGGTLTFVDEANTAKSYLAVDLGAAASSAPSATLLDEVPRQNLHGMASVDMLIISHPLFVGAAESLAKAHSELNRLKVGIVTSEQVYNEFSSGTPDATAYRWAAKMLYDRPSDKLKYLLLFGKGSFDNRGLLSLSGDKLLLTFQSENSVASDKESYASDDYFGILDDSEGNSLGERDKLDIGIGRFPAVTEAQAWGVVEKTIQYMKNENPGAWKNQLCFVGDDGDSNRHMIQANDIADLMLREYPDYNVSKILLDAYQQEVNASGQTYPLAKNRFNNLIRSGLLYVNYMGHANLNGWSNEQILTTSEVKIMKNRYLPLFSAGTCEFSRFDREHMSGGGELVLNTQGGGIGCFSSTRSVYPDQNYTLLNNLAISLFDYSGDESKTIGDAIMQAKNSTSNGGANMLSYIYLGDPAVRLSYPSPNKVALQEINGTSISAADTLRALSETNLKVQVLDKQGNKAENFNGTAQIVVLDKEETVTAFNNDREAMLNGTLISPLVYKDRPNTIFKGTSPVEKGEFDITFKLPKDIKYNYGSGRMVFTLWDEKGNAGGQGHYEDFIVGGSVSDIAEVTTGPQVEMYLNHKGFVSGAKVNETPLFTAHISDEYGVNTSSPTPGHDIMLMLDDNRSYILNDYYESKLGTYKEGSVSYQFPELEEGYYTLMFRVWNLYNVSTIKYLDFEVVKNLSPEIFSVSCYPNPAITETTIQVSHDREDEIIGMTVDVYDLSGKRIWSRTQPETRSITWDLSVGGGKKLAPGMYIYKVSVTTGDKISSFQANKIIIR